MDAIISLDYNSTYDYRIAAGIDPASETYHVYNKEGIDSAILTDSIHFVQGWTDRKDFTEIVMALTGLGIRPISKGVIHPSVQGPAKEPEAHTASSQDGGVTGGLGLDLAVWVLMTEKTVVNEYEGIKKVLKTYKRNP